jgi:hypothetical protein
LAKPLQIVTPYGEQGAIRSSLKARSPDGLGLIIAPTMVKLLLGTDISDAAITIARMAGFGLQVPDFAAVYVVTAELPKSPEQGVIHTASSIGRKSNTPIDKIHLYKQATVGKQKSYEITKPENSSSPGRHHRCRIALIRLERIGPASAITGDDDHHRRGTVPQVA